MKQTWCYIKQHNKVQCEKIYLNKFFKHEVQGANMCRQHRTEKQYITYKDTNKTLGHTVDKSKFQYNLFSSVNH